MQSHYSVNITDGRIYDKVSYCSFCSRQIKQKCSILSSHHIIKVICNVDYYVKVHCQKLNLKNYQTVISPHYKSVLKF